MEYLSDHLLVYAYHQAIDLELEEDFIELLVGEIEKRNLVIKRR